MNERGKLKKPVRDDLCIVCRYDFDSHQWFFPAGAVGGGHDFTPLSGVPIRHPRWVQPPVASGPPKVHETEGEK